MSRQLPRAFSCTALVALVILAAGCASSSLMVSQAPTKKVVVSSVHVVPGDSTVTIDPNIAQAFESQLRQNLYAGEKGKFVDGDELTISYRFIQINEGSRAARYFAGGFGAGKGSMTVEVTFSKGGVELSKINVGGEISAGVFGGSFDSAVKKAAEEAANYTLNNFHA